MSLISIQTRGGKPLAVLANFSMHYFGDQAISADYFGLFCNAMQDQLGGDRAAGALPMVAMLSHGCSGDIWRRDYTQPIPSKEEDHTITSYAEALLEVAMQAYRQVQYQEDATLSMAEARLPLRYRTPDLTLMDFCEAHDSAANAKDP